MDDFAPCVCGLRLGCARFPRTNHARQNAGNGIRITGRSQGRSDLRVMGREPAISAAPISPSMFESMGRIGEGSLDQICKRVRALLLR